MRSEPYLSNMGHCKASPSPESLHPRQKHDNNDPHTPACSKDTDSDADPEIPSSTPFPARDNEEGSNIYLANQPLHSFDNQSDTPLPPGQRVYITSDITQPTPSPEDADEYSDGCHSDPSSSHRLKSRSPSPIIPSSDPIPVTITIHAGSEKYLTLPPGDSRSEGYRIRIIGEEAGTDFASA